MDLNPLNQLTPWVIAATAAIVAVTYFVLRGVYILPYLRVMEERSRVVEMGRAQLDEAERLTVEAAAEAEETVTEARAKADEMATATRDEIEHYRRDSTRAANAEIDKLLAAGRQEITAARETEVAAVRGEALDCVTAACKQLLGRSDEVLIRTTVDGALKKVH